MKEINSIEQLRSERTRLKMQLLDTEDSIRDDFNYFTDHIRPIFNIVDFSKESFNSPVVSNIAKLVLPLIVGKVAKGVAKKGAKASVWGIAATLAAEYLAKNVSIAGVGHKIAGLFKRKSKKTSNSINDYDYYDYK